MKSMYIISPEFHRNLWLNFTPLRLAAAPLVTLSLYAIALRLDMQSVVMEGAYLLFFLTACLWGCIEAGVAIRDEITARTWDWQRLSPQTPAQLSLGKLAGATSYAWYWAFCALVIYAVEFTPPKNSTDDAAIMLARNIFFLVFGGVAGQCVAYLYTLSATSKRIEGGKFRARSNMMFGVLVALTVINYTVNVFPKDESIFDRVKDVTWYLSPFASDRFFVCSAMFFFACAVTGILRLTGAQLMYRQWPVAWVSFVLCLGAYAAGFVSDKGDAGYAINILHALFVTLLACCYFPMIAEAADVQQYGRLRAALKRNDWRHVLDNTPRWLSLVPFIVSAFAAAATVSAMRGSASGVTYMAAFMLFALRDGFVVHAIYAAPAARHNLFKIALYYVLAYGILPALHLSALGYSEIFMDYFTLSSPQGEIAASQAVTAFYFPSAFQHPLYSLAPVAVQVAVAAGLFYAVARSRRKGAA
jgi:hypothetical protein